MKLNSRTLFNTWYMYYYLSMWAWQNNDVVKQIHSVIEIAIIISFSSLLLYYQYYWNSWSEILELRRPLFPQFFFFVKMLRELLIWDLKDFRLGGKAKEQTKLRSWAKMLNQLLIPDLNKTNDLNKTTDLTCLSSWFADGI